MKTPVEIHVPQTSAPPAGEACCEAKLKDFREGMGEEAPISNDMMNEWRGECELPPL